jgi:hypothetical protein
MHSFTSYLPTTQKSVPLNTLYIAKGHSFTSRFLQQFLVELGAVAKNAQNNLKMHNYKTMLSFTPLFGYSPQLRYALLLSMEND